MHMAATKPWTLEELDRLPDDGNTYELVHGELFVTPAPTPRHEDVIDRLAAILRPYVAANALGRVYLARSAVRHAGSETEPDLMVRAQLDPISPWDQQAMPILVAEVVSPSSRQTDYEVKRRFYTIDARIPEYWIVDPETRCVCVVKPGHADVVCDSMLEWHPSGGREPLVVDVQSLFR